MKIKELRLRNFGEFVDFDVEFDGNHTRLVGCNGAGKSTVGHVAIWAAFKGMAEKGKDAYRANRFHFIGRNGKSADVSLTLIDAERNAEIVVSNHITKAGNRISFKAPKDYPLDEKWIEGLLSVVFMSAANFVERSPKEQALALGIDTAKHDASIAELKREFTLLNHDKKQLGPLPTLGEKRERVSVSALVEQKDEIAEFNEEQGVLYRAYKELEVDIEDDKKEVERLKLRINANTEKLKTTKKPEQHKNDSAVRKQIEDADETNRVADEYERNSEAIKKHESADAALTKNKKKQDAAVTARMDYIKRFSLPFKSLSIDDDGGLMIKGRPLSTFSKGEQERIVARLHASTDPDLMWRFIDNFEALDEKNQVGVLKDLFDAGFQVITSEVNGNPDKPNTVILRECAIVKKGEEDKPELIEAR